MSNSYTYPILSWRNTSRIVLHVGKSRDKMAPFLALGRHSQATAIECGICQLHNIMDARDRAVILLPTAKDQNGEGEENEKMLDESNFSEARFTRGLQ